MEMEINSNNVNVQTDEKKNPFHALKDIIKDQEIKTKGLKYIK